MTRPRKIPAAIEASLRRGRLGLRSRIGDDIAGAPLLRHTVEKLLATRDVDRVWLITSADEAGDIARLADGLNVGIFPSDEPDIPLRPRLRRGRLWALGAWRGGLGHGYFAAEAGRPRSLRALAEKLRASHLLVAPAEAPLLAPHLVDELVEGFRQEGSQRKLYLATCAPGLGADLFSAEILDVFAAAGRSVDGILDFRMDAPDHYVDGLGMFHWYPNAITGLRARLCADTDRSFSLAARVIAHLGPGWRKADAPRTLAALRDDPRLTCGDWPQELVIELTARRHHVGPIDGPVAVREGDIPLETLRALIEESGARDDVRYSLGILGEPFLHPGIHAVLELLAARRPFGLHVHTDGLAVTGEHLDLLAACDPDVISVGLDAATAPVYARVHGIDGYDRAVQTVTRMAERFADRGTFVVPEFTVCDANRNQVEAFYDLWYTRLGWVTIRDHDDLAGQRPRRLAQGHLPPERTFCAHLAEELAVLPNGSFVLCRQDIHGVAPQGRAGADPIAEVWQRRPLECALCPACRAWAF